MRGRARVAELAMGVVRDLNPMRSGRAVCTMHLCLAREAGVSRRLGISVSSSPGILLRRNFPRNPSIDHSSIYQQDQVLTSLSPRSMQQVVAFEVRWLNEARDLRLVEVEVIARPDDETRDYEIREATMRATQRLGSAIDVRSSRSLRMQPSCLDLPSTIGPNRIAGSGRL